jgi:hypothetical protein
MRLVAAVWRALRDPSGHWRAILPCQSTSAALFGSVALPLSAVAGVAVLIRSLLASSLLPGIVLGVGSVVLQLGCWLGLGLLLPALARQFKVELSNRDAFALATWALVPMWLAGVVLVVPEVGWMVTIWSRILLLIGSLYGLVIFYHGISALGAERPVRPPIVAAAGTATLVLYLVLSASLGLTSHLVLFLLSARA